MLSGKEATTISNKEKNVDIKSVYQTIRRAGTNQALPSTKVGYTSTNLEYWGIPIGIC
jgi:hypothetical protein